MIKTKQVDTKEITKQISFIDELKQYDKSLFNPYIIKSKGLKTTEVFDAYWRFACERQKVFFKKYEGKTVPWTNDPIIKTYKFTNAYRASDRVSQYLIKNVIYNGEKYSPEDTFFRIILFKLFNKIDTWEYLEKSIGEINFKDYSYDKYNRALLNAINEKNTIYSAAYIMPSGSKEFGCEKKHQNNLKLIELMMKDNVPEKIAKIKTLKELYELLLSYPTVGSFLAFQYAIDINYSELCDFDEMSFVVAGPGAKRGIEKSFEDKGKYTYEDIIKYMAENQEEHFKRLDLDFKSLWGRRLQLIDCQNLFCETDKYSRVAFPDCNSKVKGKRIKQKYKANLKAIDFFYPPKWGINEKIK